MNRTEGTVGILAPPGPDRELIREIIESQGWDATFPVEGPAPEGPWHDIDVIVVDAAWLESCKEGIERTKGDAGSEFVPVLMVSPEDRAPERLEGLFDQVLTYPTTRAAFSARVASLMRARSESRRVYRSFFENTVIGVYRATKDGTVLMANDVLAQMLGHRDVGALKASGARIPELAAASDGAASPLIESLDRTGVAKGIAGHWSVDTADAIHVVHSARLVRASVDGSGQAVVEGTVEDVTDLVESRERLARSERFLQSSIDALSAHVAILAPDGTIVGVNQAWRRFEAGSRPPEADDVGVNYLEICRQADDPVAARVGEGIGDVIDGELPVFRIEYPCHSPTHYRWFRVVVTAFPEEPPRRVVVAHENVTELKEAQKHFQLLIEGSSELTVVIDPEGIIRYRSPSLAVSAGRPDLVGIPLQDLAHPADRAVIGGLAVSVDGEETVDFRIRGADGAWRDIEWTVTDMRDEPMVHGLVLHGRDVTERKSMLAELKMREREMRQMQKMEAVGRLAGGVAHDFNNLLTTIQGNLRLMKDALDDAGAPVEEDVGQYLSEIVRAAEQGSFLTRRLLVFSRKEPEAEPSVEDLNEILQGLAKMLQRLVPESIEFEVALADRPLPVRIRPGEIEQIVINLTVNAGDAMPGGGTFTIRTHQVEVGVQGTTRILPPDLKDGCYVVLEAIDTGQGIPSELQEKIFEPFFTTKPRGEGTGLGLATIYGILQRAGGGITVQSDPGQGSHFSAYLPLDVEGLAEPMVETTLDTEPEMTDETVLLVEDEAPVRMVARRGLERFGYTVLEAENGAEALEVLASPEGADVALIVSDFIMPVMSGLELAKAVHVRYPGLPVLITSGYPDSEIDLPADMMWNTLSKPYDLLELSNVSRKMIRQAGTTR